MGPFDCHSILRRRQGESLVKHKMISIHLDDFLTSQRLFLQARGCFQKSVVQNSKRDTFLWYFCKLVGEHYRTGTLVFFLEINNLLQGLKYPLNQFLQLLIKSILAQIDVCHVMSIPVVLRHNFRKPLRLREKNKHEVTLNKTDYTRKRSIE